MDHIFSVRSANGNRYDAIGSDELQLHFGDYCIVRKDNCIDYALVIRFRPMVEGFTAPAIQRKATMQDQATATENEARSKSAFRTALQMVELMGLPMNLLNACYSFDQRLCTIQFTADGRVDFRELVKELSKSLGCRLDLRQIGVRDETGICGGIAVCGQPLCCARFLREFSAINVRMAKEQDLSLTPSSISGVCGRLKCCLKYEHEGYVEMEKSMPRRGEICDSPRGRGRVSDRNLLTRKVTLNLEDGGQALFSAEELRYRHREKPGSPEEGPEYTSAQAAERPYGAPRQERGSAANRRSEPAKPVLPGGSPVSKENPAGNGSGNPPEGEGGRNRKRRRNKHRRDRESDGWEGERPENAGGDSSAAGE